MAVDRVYECQDNLGARHDEPPFFSAYHTPLGFDPPIIEFGKRPWFECEETFNHRGAYLLAAGTSIVLGYGMFESGCRGGDLYTHASHVERHKNCRERNIILDRATGFGGVLKQWFLRPGGLEDKKITLAGIESRFPVLDRGSRNLDNLQPPSVRQNLCCFV